MVHYIRGCTQCVHVKLCDPLRTRAIPEHLRGVFMTRHYSDYTHPCLPLPYLTLLYLWNSLSGAVLGSSLLSPTNYQLVIVFAMLLPHVRRCFMHGEHCVVMA